jgi:hypothetical protein
VEWQGEGPEFKPSYSKKKFFFSEKLNTPRDLTIIFMCLIIKTKIYEKNL